MTLEKAIEILEDCSHGALLGISKETKDALKLGIEALERLREHRLGCVDFTFRALPGETEE